jgi:hypothetical protein
MWRKTWQVSLDCFATSMKAGKLYNFLRSNPRRNLPGAISRKRGEANFVSAFTKAYLGTIGRHGIGGRQFALSGFGIADFVWIAWRKSQDGEEGSAVSLEQLRTRLSRQKLAAFEMKLTDWRKGLAQAYRYSYFADLSVVVMPAAVVDVARENLALFRLLRIALWSFDQPSGKIRKLFTPRSRKARSVTAKMKALALFTRYFDFSQRSK